MSRLSCCQFGKEKTINMLHVSFTLHFFFLWLPHDVVTKMKRQRNNEKFISTRIHYYQKVSRLIIWLFNWSSWFKRTKRIWIYSLLYLAQRPSQNVSFTIARPLWWWVGQSEKQKQKQKQKQKKERKNEHLKGSGFQRRPGPSCSKHG